MIDGWPVFWAFDTHFVRRPLGVAMVSIRLCEERSPVIVGKADATEPI